MGDDNTNQNSSTNVNVDTGNIKNSTVNISSIIEDNSGGLSSTRILMLMWGIGILLIWGFGAVMATIHGLPFPALPPEIVTLTLGLTGAKVVQRFGER